MVILCFTIGTSFLVSDSYAEVLEIRPIGNLSIDEGEKLAFIVEITDTSLDNVRFSLASNAPSGASISSSSGSFTWTPSNTQSGTYTFDVIAKTSSLEYRESITITVKEPTQTLPYVLSLRTISDKTITEGKTLSFTASVTDSSLDKLIFSLENPPSGASINSSTGQFIWTPSAAQGNVNGIQYNFDIVVEKGTQRDSKSITITVKDPVTFSPVELGIAPFVEPNQDPQYYVDRYNNEPNYKKWFDDNFPEYDSIYQAVGLEEPLAIPAPFVEPYQDPQYYVNRYNNEPDYKKWFDDNFPEYDSIYQAVGLKETTQLPTAPEPKPKIPEWVRNIFNWYADERISEDEINESMEFLIAEGIIKV